MRTQAQIRADMQPKVKRIDELFAAGKARETKSCTTEELAEIDTLQGEVDVLEAEFNQVKRVDEIEAKNNARKAMFSANINAPGHQNGGEGPGDTTKAFAEFPFSESLKNFRGATNAEANQKAYRFGKWLHANVFTSHPGSEAAKQWCGENIKAAQAEGTIQDGGFLVPTEFERTLIDLREMYGSFRANAKTEPMAYETKQIPRRTGGLTAYFVGEAAAGTTSAKAGDLVTLVAKKLMCLVPYSTEIAEDSIINLADDLAGEIAYAFALKEDNCGFLGDGTSTYGGITGVINKLLGLSGTIANIAGIRVQATISTGTFASAILGDFQATIAKLPKYADTPNAKWYMHKTFYHSVPATLLVAAGGNSISDLQKGAREQTFLGYPVEFVQVMPTVWVANQIFALFGDLNLAASFGDRRKTTLFSDPYSLSANDQVQIRGTERFDINIHDVGNASATAASRVPGPIVAFASAAS
jgi:HK97 family phage major capsid protein